MLNDLKFSIDERIEPDKRKEYSLYADAIYYCSKEGTTYEKEVISKLLPVKNCGGVRFIGSVNEPKMVVLYTTGTHAQWEDYIDYGTGIFTYYGDNDNPDREVTDTNIKGNLILKNIFELAKKKNIQERKKIPPIFVFMNDSSEKNAVRFIGLVVPGNPETKETLKLVNGSSNGRKYDNYKATFTVLDTNKHSNGFSLEWITDIENGKAYESSYAPIEWRNFIEDKLYNIYKDPNKPTVKIQVINNTEENEIDFKIDNQFKEHENYIYSLLAKQFVILLGNSGTGKTNLAINFARWLSKNPNNVHVEPVGADWTDNTKILGYYNSLTEKYEKTKILELIEDANRNPTEPYFLILDEMNLSVVERYFSDFLSHMEITSEPFKLDHYNSVLFPQNLFITGTVNVDETTYMFSPKVLDRANVIEVKPNMNSILNLMSNQPSPETGIITKAQSGTSKAFLKLSQKIKKEEIDSSDLNFRLISAILSEFYTILETCNFEFAYRTVKEIKRYLYAAHELDTAEKNDDWIIKRMDEQILQKMLPKIHGNKREIELLLRNLIVLCSKTIEYENDSGENESKELNLKKSKIKLESMLNKLNATQYVSFI